MRRSLASIFLSALFNFSSSRDILSSARETGSAKFDVPGAGGAGAANGFGNIGSGGVACSAKLNGCGACGSDSNVIGNTVSNALSCVDDIAGVSGI